MAKKRFVITRAMLNQGLPPRRTLPDGGCNVVLVLHSDKVYSRNGSNSYMPKWGISNTVYYRKHPDMFEGWIDLEDVMPPWDSHGESTAKKKSKKGS